MLTTYQATFETGWRATLRAGSKVEARKRFKMTGRGERFSFKEVTADTFRVWGKDSDDDYSEGE